jgi:hypothetical protein
VWDYRGLSEWLQLLHFNNFADYVEVRSCINCCKELILNAGLQGPEGTLAV